MSGNRKDEEAISAQDIADMAIKLYDRAQKAKDKWSPENQASATNTIREAISMLSPKLVGIGLLAINKVELKNTSKDENFHISTDISKDRNTEFYRITLKAYFRREMKTRFTYAEIAVNMVESNNEPETQIYSVAPSDVNESIPSKKIFGLNPKIELSNIVALDPGISFSQVREYTEIHPLIKALFDAKQDVSWQYMTSQGVKEIAGTQTLELIIKQPSGTLSAWTANFSDVKLYWRDRWMTLKSWVKIRKVPRLDDISRLEDRFKTFNVPSVT